MSPVAPAALPAIIEFGREICASLPDSESREWLVTNGIGGFASGTVSGILTRRYHGLLVAALEPPVGRTLLVTKVEESTRYAGQSFSLGANRWRGGTLDPQGWANIERFRLEGTIPAWTFALGDARLEKRIWMQQRANTTFVFYSLTRASAPVELSFKVLVNYRDYHGSTHAGDWRMQIDPVAHGLRVVAFDGAVPFFLLSDAAIAAPAHEWYRNFDLAIERERGLDDSEDHLFAGTFTATLAPGASLTFAASTDSNASLDGAKSLAERAAADRALLDKWTEAQPSPAKKAPSWVRQLALTADSFLVERSPAVQMGAPREPCKNSVIAGYHWFANWGRDTMIALPGLTLATGRPEIAHAILRSYARFADRGMLPNTIPEGGEAILYNTVDAALWFFEAARQTFAVTKDISLLQELFPVLADIVEWHVRGTRYQIHADAADGLLYAGEPGVQLTWMDARVGGHVVTPRIGKPIEVNALWLNALVTMAGFASTLGQSADRYSELASKARAAFARFWNPATGHCFDVLDGPTGNESALRPNQIFAVSLPESSLTPEQQRAVVDACARELLVPGALRTLAAREPGYRGRYFGGPGERDAAYHEGTAWAWLVGPFVQAHLRVYGDPAAAMAFLEPFALQVQTYGLGSLAEICDGDAPFAPRGCISQAWSVAEALRAWSAVASFSGVEKKQSDENPAKNPAQSRGRKTLPPESSPRKPSRSKRG
jgi:predicted glycogen debranching enzyme